MIDDIEIRKGSIVIADVATIHLCPLNHHTHSVNFDTLMTRCKTCAAFCRTRDVTTQMEAMLRVKFKSGIAKMTLKDSVLRKLLELDPLTKIIQLDVLVAKLLVKEHIEL